MKKRLTRIAPLRAGIVLTVLYGILGLLLAPIILFSGCVAVKTGTPQTMPMPAVVVLAVVLPFVYAAIGFLMGVIGAAIYNLIARWTGGLEFEVTDILTVSK